MVEKSAGYALVMNHALRHVGLKLEGAAPAALSFADLTQGYDHPVPSDLSRVRLHEKQPDDRSALNWIIRNAVIMLNGALVVDGEMVSFAPGKGFDDLEWASEKSTRKVTRPEPDSKFGDAFNPMSGPFSDNIREELGDLTQLRESMKAWGWLPEHPALADERGVVLVGHRRIKVAKELGIEPVIKTIKMGFGDAADAERFRLAIGSNLGAKKLSPNDRKRIAQQLYGADWRMEQIAEALTVTHKTISRDLEGFVPMSKPHRPKGGRPRKEEPKSLVEEAAGKRRVTPEQEAKIADLVEQGVTTLAIAKQVGVGHVGVQLAKARHIGRLEERERMAGEHACTCPVCGHKH